MSKRAVTPINNLIDQGSSGTVENFDQEVHSLPVCEEIVNEIWQDVAEKQYIKDLLRRRIKPYVIKNAISVCLETIPPQELNGDYSTLIDSLKETMSKQQDHFREVQYKTRSIYPVREEDCSEVRIELGAGGETSSFVGDMSKGRGPPMNIDMLDISLEPSSVSGGRGYDTRSPGISAQSQYTSKKQPAALAQIRGRKSKIIQQGIKDNTPMLSGHKSLKHDSDSQTLKSTGRPGRNLDKRSEQRVKTPSSDGSETHPKMNKQYPLRWANPKQTAQQLMQSLFVQKMREQLIADRKREAFEAQFKTKESSQEKPASSKKEQRSHEKIKKLKDIGGPLMLAKVSSKAECTQSAQERWADLQYQQVQKQALRQGRQPTMTKQDFVNMKMAEKRGTGRQEIANFLQIFTLRA